MKIKRIEESNFDEISQWWLDWEIPIPDPDYYHTIVQVDI